MERTARHNLTRPFKIFASILHLFFLGLIVTSICILYVNANFGRGIAWIQSESYIQSDLFYNQLQADITAIFDYARLRDAFEIDGELDMEKEILSINYGPNSTEVYTLSDVIDMGNSYGYFLQDDWSINVLPVNEDLLPEEAVLVEYKSYDPEPVLKEPGQAYAKMKDVCYEALSNYCLYSYIQQNIITGSTNLSFQLTCKNENAMLPGKTVIYTNLEDPSWEKFRHMGLYVEYTADAMRVETNMAQVPSYIMDLVEDTRFIDQTFEHFILSVDTNFPHMDSYTQEAIRYDDMRQWTMRGVFLMGCGILGCILSLLYLVATSGHNDKSHDQIGLYPFDHMSAEGCILLFITIGAVCCYIGKVAGFRILHLVVADANWYFSEKLLLYVIVYLVLLLCCFSLLRRFKAGTLWKKSWLRKLCLELSAYLTMEASAHTAAYTYVGFLALNISCSYAAAYLLFNLETLQDQLLFAALLAFWAALDLACFYFTVKKARQDDQISQAITNIASGDISYCVDVEDFSGKQRVTADHINHIGKNLDGALREKVKSERFKADLITNVSHDLKTPLTSIINYVDLIKREKIQNERVQGYLTVLEQKSQRLKTLTEDLVEASKASSGNLKLEITDIDFVELVNQTNGEFEEKFAQRHLSLVSRLPEQPILIQADGRRLWRFLENLYNNAFKYAMEQSRIYVDMTTEGEMVVFTIKNISEHPLNISSEELTERFVRGDVSRTTEGSGLGLSIAQSLTQLQKGVFELVIDGDLFKAYVRFPIKKEVDGGNPPESVLE